MPTARSCAGSVQTVHRYLALQQSPLPGRVYPARPKGGSVSVRRKARRNDTQYTPVYQHDWQGHLDTILKVVPNRDAHVTIATLIILYTRETTKDRRMALHRLTLKHRLAGPQGGCRGVLARNLGTCLHPSSSLRERRHIYIYERESV